MPYTFLQLKNNAYSTLNGGIVSGATTLVVTSAATFPTSGNFMCTIWNKTTYPDCSLDPNMEIVLVTGVSGTTFTITKAQEGTPDNNHNNGDNIEALLTAGMLTEIETRANANFNTKTITSNYIAALGDYLILCNALSGPITVTLPSAAALPGNVYVIKKIDSSSNPITVDPFGSQTIDGQLTQTIGYQGTAVNFTSDGSNYWMS